MLPNLYVIIILAALVAAISTIAAACVLLWGKKAEESKHLKVGRSKLGMELLDAT